MQNAYKNRNPCIIPIILICFERCLTMSVVRYENILYFCHALGYSPKRTYFDESVFAFVLNGKCSSFQSNGTTNSTHFLFRLWARCTLRTVKTPYLFKCGVSRRLLLLGSCYNLPLDKRNQLHTFLL